ncbi:hypothetical protein H4R34_000187 [Dimargaris verticillata]|uniref:RRM domain-containing protein n=1 Tax=Dimargaris verticillata TaxID=2761393 RepID=A0A9W8EBL3_9FUNG|nr:hypothetical protein H4R34_000187 [Dimargaris verticillata]
MDSRKRPYRPSQHRQHPYNRPPRPQPAEFPQPGYSGPSPAKTANYDANAFAQYGYDPNSAAYYYGAYTQPGTEYAAPVAAAYYSPAGPTSSQPGTANAQTIGPMYPGTTPYGPLPPGTATPSGGESSTSSKPKKRKIVRAAGGEIWEDNTLNEWDENDYRLFAGDLGNEVTDDMLTKAFSKYPTFLKAKVVRDKKTGKTRGFGFISFKDPTDYSKAWREMNGKYVGNRPIKLRKSTWKDRNIDKKRLKNGEILLMPRHQ